MSAPIDDDQAYLDSLAPGPNPLIPRPVVGKMSLSELKQRIDQARVSRPVLGTGRKPDDLPASDFSSVCARGFSFVRAHDLVASATTPQWGIKYFLEEGSFLSMVGPSGHYKTFVALDMGLSLAARMAWHGNRVSGGPVLYLCGEGKNGILKRVQAWAADKQVPIPPFFISTMAGQFLDDRSLQAIEEAAQEVAVEHGPPALLIIDTLNRNFGPGDENNTSDMTAFIQAVDWLRGKLDCAVMIVHHTGLGDMTRGRGSSALRGAVDFEYLIEKTGATLEEQIVTMTCSKVKDHEPPPKMAFRPVLVDFGYCDEDGAPIMSVVLEQTEQTPTREKRLSGGRKIALAALESLVTQTGEKNISESLWRSEAYSRGIADSDDQDAKKKAFQRARAFLLENEFIGTRDGLFWLHRDRRDGTGQTGFCPGRASLGDGTDGTHP